MKAVWKGYLGFGLVNIPVALYSAIDKQKLSFNLLHAEDKGHIKYKRFCETCGNEINWDKIVKGLEIGKNEYYVISKNELEKFKPEGSKLIEIQEFIKDNEIDPIYHDKSYFIGPTPGGIRPYFLFKATLEKTRKSAIGKFVMRKNEYISEIRPYKKGLLLITLNYAHEVRDIERVPKLDEHPKLKQKEEELAIQLIEKFTSKSFEISKYKDTFTEEIKEAIREEVKGEFITMKGKEIQETENLMEALKASLD